MGRLNASNFIKIFGQWVLPVVFALIIVAGYHSLFADPNPTVEELQAYLQDNTLGIGSEVVDGYQQIFYAVNDKKTFVTQGTENNVAPVGSGQYIAWARQTNMSNQILLHDVLTQTTLLLSGEGSNQNPVIDGNRVVWEKWTPAGWQLQFYDGFSVKQLSQDYVSVRPQIKDDKIVYAQQLPGSNAWRVVSYTISNNQEEIISVRDETQAWPHFKGSNIETKYDPSL